MRKKNNFYIFYLITKKARLIDHLASGVQLSKMLYKIIFEKKVLNIIL